MDPETIVEPVVDDSTAISTNPSDDAYIREEPDDKAFLESAPLIGKKVEGEGVEDVDISTDGEGKPIKKETTDQQPVKKQTPAKEKLFKIGEVELPENEWLEGVSAKKDMKDMSNWKASMTKKSGLFNAFKDEDLDLLYGYVVNQKEVPKDFREKIELPEEF